MDRESQLKIESWMRHKGLGLMFRYTVIHLDRPD